MEGYCPVSDGLTTVYSRNRPPQDQEKKCRREIANKNERRRMQSINSGFIKLKSLIPHHDDEKLSKSATLQQAGEYIQSLENQNAQLKNLLIKRENEREREKEFFNDSPPPKRKKRDTESSDEGISMGSLLDCNEDGIEDIQRAKIVQLESKLRKEELLRAVLEERINSMENKLFTEKLNNVNSTHVQTDINIDKMTNEFIEVQTYDDPPRVPYTSYTSSPMMENNLGLFIEAIAIQNGEAIKIRHVDGGKMMTDDLHCERRIPRSDTDIHTRCVDTDYTEEIERDISDDQETKSDSSDQEVPIAYTHRIHRHRLQTKYQNITYNTGGGNPHLHHGQQTTILQPYNTQFYSPGVIVRSSSS